MKKADTWPGALQGSNANVDPVTLEGMQKKIMLERFQSEVIFFGFVFDFVCLGESVPRVCWLLQQSLCTLTNTLRGCTALASKRRQQHSFRREDFFLSSTWY